jgi:hypothetical protein
VTDRTRRLEALEQWLQPTAPVPDLTLAQSRADADEQLRQLAPIIPTPIERCS